MKKYNQNIVALLVILTLFLLLLVLLALSFISIMHGSDISRFMFIFVKYHIHFMAVLGVLGAMLGIVAYKGFSDQQKQVTHSREFSKNILARFLDKSENIVVDFLLKEGNGIVTQAHISRLKEMGKVKAHRTVQRLIDKEVIKVKKYGKSKRIELFDDIAELLRE